MSDPEVSDKKRPHSDNDDDQEQIGPSLSEATPAKKKKVLEFEKLYLNNLPLSEAYEKSYMHRDSVTHVVCTKTDFIVTASCDGHVKFWKKSEQGIEFVKHFRSHLTAVVNLAANCDGTLLCSISTDKCVKVFDVINFDMINMIKLEYVPLYAEWIHSSGDAVQTLAISDSTSTKIHIYDGRGTNEPLHTLEKLHTKPVILMRYNAPYETIISIDKAGIIEYWSGLKNDFKFPERRVQFDSKLDTGLYELAKNKTYPSGLCVSPDGRKFATISVDRKVRVFVFETGKLIRVYDEAIARCVELQQKAQIIPSMEFSKRMAVERELERNDAFGLINITFDESGHFLLYSTMLGVKVLNTWTNKCARIIGKAENIRLLQCALFQGKISKTKAAVTLEQEASNNPTLLATKVSDPTLFCTAYKKNRFYLFSQREYQTVVDPNDDRDVFNEKPSKEDVISATEQQHLQRIFDNAVIHTTLGDIFIKLFSKECPKTIENFCVHAKNGYFNGHIWHRVIKGFMIQTGDPTGNGTGGESIWGGEFEDEFHPNLKHDRPYTLSMANAGPNTNGSQFFVTVTPTPWLDNKHTVFGRVVKGMEVVQNISNVKTNPKTDKPHDEIRIISVTVK